MSACERDKQREIEIVREREIEGEREEEVRLK